MHHSLAFWIGFNLFVLAMLALDLGLHRRSPVMGFKTAMAWTGFWIFLAAAFAGLVFFQYGKTSALQFITGYVVEESLSIDNLFVFLVLFRYFRVPREYQHKVLLWGVMGALVMRLLFILLGVSLLERFEFLIYVFGAILVYSGIGLLRDSEPDVDPDKNLILKIFRRFFPVVPEFEGDKFFVRREGRRMATPLFLALIVVETTDLIFAVDSIPAILAITRDAFIVYTSNVFAILGLRSLYFALAGMMEVFHYLHYGLSAVLIFVGIKMIGAHYIHIPTVWALGIVILVLGTSVVASLMRPKKA